AMVDAALNVAAEQIIEYAAYGTILERAGNRGPRAAPQNLYLTSDVDEQDIADCWVAIAVEKDEQWLALRAAVGQPAWAMDPALLDEHGRRARHDVIDEHLAEWCGSRSSDEIVDLLWSVGVPVGKVMLPHDQPQVPALAVRGYFESVD